MGLGRAETEKKIKILETSKDLYNFLESILKKKRNLKKITSIFVFFCEN